MQVYRQLHGEVPLGSLDLPAISEYVERKRMVDGRVKALADRMGRKPVLMEDGCRDQAMQM